MFSFSRLAESRLKSLRFFILGGVFLVGACASGQITELGGVSNHDSMAAADELAPDEIDETYAKNVYGSVLNCVVTGGTAVFTEGWHDYNPKEFRIIRGERKIVKLSHFGTEGLNTRFQTSFDRTGQKLSFCEIVRPSKFGSLFGVGEAFDIDIVDSFKLGSLKTGKCVSIYALPMDFEPGIRRTLDVPNTLRGSTVMCSYSPDPAGPEHSGRAYEEARRR